MKETVRRLLENAVDFHLHVGPDPYRERIGDVYDIALQAKNVGMRAVVFKSYDYPTAPLAQLAKRFVQGIDLIGSLTLNYGVGGINPHAVEASAKLGARVIWMPTASTLYERQKQGFADGIFILDERGKPVPAVREVLKLVKEFDLVLCTGHITKDETVALFNEATNMGIKKFVVTHPLKVAGSSLDFNLQKELADRGATIEHTFVMTVSLTKRVDPATIAEAIKFVGVERCLLSTDFGQFHNPPPAEGMRMMLATLMQYGLSEGDLNILVKQSPCRLLGL